MVGIKDRFGQTGTTAELKAEYGLTASDIAKAVKEVINLYIIPGNY